MEKELSEPFVIDSVIKWLKKKGYDTELIVNWEGTGVDISVRHNLYPEYFFVEAKGETPNRLDYFLTALGQIITRIFTPPNSEPNSVRRYAIAFPKSYSTIAFRRVSWELSKKLNLEILLVNEKGEVDEKTWEDLKKLDLYREIT